MLTPEQIARPGTEHAEQCALMQWAVTCGVPDIDLLFAIPNGGDRSPHVGAKMKAEGVKPGVPDLLWPVPKGRYAGLFIEMKRANSGATSSSQDKWISRLRGKRYRVEVCHGWLRARDLILEYASQ